MKEQIGSQGTPEEILNAETNHLTEAMKDSSEARENYLKNKKEAGINGEIYKRHVDEIDAYELQGEIDGIKFNVIPGEFDDLDKCKGTINGIELTQEQAKQLYQKYMEYAFDEGYDEGVKSETEWFQKTQTEEYKRMEEERIRKEEEEKQKRIEEEEAQKKLKEEERIRKEEEAKRKVEAKALFEKLM